LVNRLAVPIVLIVFFFWSGCIDNSTNKEPALTINFTEINLCFKKVGETYTWQNMQVANSGSADLTIANIEIRGDANCAFKCFREAADNEATNQMYECSYEHENSPPFQMTLTPGEVRLIKIEYTPSQVGISDTATLAIESDARNFTVNSEAVDGTPEDYIWQKRLIPMCGTGIDTEIPADECAEVDAGCGDALTADAPGCGEI
jgi:hypothetical protein